MPVDIRDREGNSPCHSACEAGQLKVMNYFVNCRVTFSYHSRNFQGDTLLHLACKSGCVPLIRMISDNSLCYYYKLNEYHDKLDCQSVSLVKNSSGHTPIHTACLHNHFDVIKLFFTKSFPRLLFLIPSLLILAHEQNHEMLISYFLAKETENNFSGDYKGNLPIRKTWISKQDEISLSKEITKVKSDIGNLDEPALFIFVRKGNVEQYNKFITLFSDKKIYKKLNSHGETLLHAATVSCNVNLVKQLFEALVPNHFTAEDLKSATNCFGFTCLHLACEYGSLELVEYFIHVGFSRNEKTKEGHATIHISIMHDRKDIFEYLLSFDDAPINSKADRTGETPLHIATYEKSRIDYVKQIVKHSHFNSGNEKDENGETPLFNACRTGCIEMVDILLNEPTCSDISVVNRRHESVASIAMRLHSEDLLDRLLHHLSNSQYKPEASLFKAVWDCDCLAFESSNLLCHNSDSDMIDTPRTCKMIEVLICKADQYKYSLASDLKCGHRSGTTILHEACERNDFVLFKRLLSLPDCNGDTKDNGGNTVLHISCENNRMNFVQECLSKCNALSRNNQEKTPLHVAIDCGNLAILRYILDNIDDKLDGYFDNSGNTVLHALASKNSVTDLLKLILNKKLVSHQSKTQIDGNTALHIACKDENTLENVKLLITRDYDKSSWYNNRNESPLVLALKAGIFEKVIDKIPPKYFSTCSIVQREKVHGDFYDDPIEFPLLLFCIGILFCHQELSQYSSNIQNNSEFVGKLIKNQSLPVHDSQGNSVFHYLAMCPYTAIHRDMGIVDKIFECYSEYITSINKYGDSALHVAVSQTPSKDWLIKKILDHGVPRDFINKGNRKGRLINLTCSLPSIPSRLTDMTYYLIAKGAKHNILPHNVHSRVCKPVLHVPVVGNSGVGKSTLINTLNSLNIGSKNKVKEVKKHTPGIVPTEIFYEGNYYQFFDFGGQMEYEAGHAKILQNLVQSSKSKLEKTFAFFIMVRATEKMEEIKSQIQKWLNFLREKANALQSSVSVFVICSHADRIDTDEMKTNIYNEITMFMSKADTNPLRKNEDPIMINCLTSKHTELNSSIKLMMLLEKECSLSLSIPLSYSSQALYYTISQNDKFLSLPYQLKDLVEYIKENQQFEIDESGHLQLTATSKPLMTSDIPECLSEDLEELHIKNYIMLLKPTSEKFNTPESCLKWWIIPKMVQEDLLSHASSIFNSKKFQEKSKELPLTAKTGIVPLSLLKDVFNDTKARFELDVFLTYLVDMEYCIRIESDIIFNKMISRLELSERERSCYSTENLYFFPEFLKESKPDSVYMRKQNKKYFFGAILKTKSKFGVEFLHTLLLRLTLEATQSSSKLSSSSYSHISIWNNGISWCTQDRVDILVEVQKNSKVIVLSRGEKRHVTAKHTSKVMSDIKELKEELIRRNRDIPHFVEDYLHPPPQDYKSYHESEPIPFKVLREYFKEPVDCRSLPSNPTSDTEEENLLPFDPYMVLQPEIIEKLNSNELISTGVCNDFDDYINDILKSEGVERYGLSYEKLNSILDKYSIFKGERLV